jgi:Asp-tRNA(Asn)/Glu-tRNA(Gln) amidotransferase C subunit
VSETDAKTIEALARVAQIDVPEEDRELLRLVFENQSRAIDQLDSVDVSEVEPIVSFDPRWR